jgi:hypothetical protein
MLKNLSRQTDTLLPHLISEDVAEAIVWLTKAFGFDHRSKKSQPLPILNQLPDRQLHRKLAPELVFVLRLTRRKRMSSLRNRIESNCNFGTYRAAATKNSILSGPSSNAATMRTENPLVATPPTHRRNCHVTSHRFMYPGVSLAGTGTTFR